MQPVRLITERDYVVPGSKFEAFIPQTNGLTYTCKEEKRPVLVSARPLHLRVRPTDALTSRFTQGGLTSLTSLAQAVNTIFGLSSIISVVLRRL